jgi:hypothetical protein
LNSMTGFYERGCDIRLGRKRGSRRTCRVRPRSLLRENPQRTPISRIASETRSLQWLSRARA